MRERKQKEQATKYLTALQKNNPTAIIGRAEDLEQLATQLRQRERLVLMNGMGGIGKTTLAEAYVYNHEHEYERIAWITQTDVNIINDFVVNTVLLQNLGIEIGADAKVEEVFAAIMNALRNLPGSPKLLIIDNALSHMEQLLHQLPQSPD